MTLRLCRGTVPGAPLPRTQGPKNAQRFFLKPYLVPGPKARLRQGTFEKPRNKLSATDGHKETKNNKLNFPSPARLRSFCVWSWNSVKPKGVSKRLVFNFVHILKLGIVVPIYFGTLLGVSLATPKGVSKWMVFKLASSLKFERSVFKWFWCPFVLVPVWFLQGTEYRRCKLHKFRTLWVCFPHSLGQRLCRAKSESAPKRFLFQNSRPAKRGGFQRGGFSDLDLSFLFVLFCPFWDFPDFSGIVLICSGMVRGFSRFVPFLFLGLLRAPMRNSPERVRDTSRTFPEKSGKPPGLENPRFGNPPV